MVARKSKLEIPTIDVNLVTIQLGEDEFGFDTSNKISVSPNIETTDGVKLIIKGVLKAQKREKKTLTGHTITLTDNVFNPDLVVALQGGEIVYDREVSSKITGYNPPAVGTETTSETFTLNAYSAVYNAAGQITKYEKISYPNCIGEPVAFSSEDGAFRSNEYTITSSPDIGEKPYQLTYVDSLPELTE